MASDILTIIRGKMKTFSKGQKRIANFILSSYDKAAFLTASRLGSAVDVSESTVVRFAVELGYEGYPQMQKALQEMILNRLTSVQRIEVANDRMKNQDIIAMVSQMDIEKIRMTSEMIDRKTFQAAVDAIVNARRIYILGMRSSAALVSFLGFYYGYMFDNLCIITSQDTGGMFEQIARITGEDVVIGISFPRYSTSTIAGIQYCRKAGATVIGLTDDENSPVGRYADHVLVAKSDMVSLVDSLAAPLSLINALIVATARCREKELSQTLATLEKIWDEFDVYEKSDDG